MSKNLYNKVYNELKGEYLPPEPCYAHIFCIHKVNYDDKDVTCCKCRKYREEKLNKAVEQRVKEIMECE